MKYLSLLFKLLCQNHLHLTHIYVSMDEGIHVVFIYVDLKNALFLLDLLGLFGQYRSLDHTKEEF